MASEFEIIVGTYEQYMLGYKIERGIGAKYSIKQTFAIRSHTGSIRAVTGCARFLASAGSDDRVFIYDMNSRKEIQMLIHHKGTVNTISFTPKATHIVTGSSDGAIAVVRTGNWQMEKLWATAHKRAAVNNVAVHPSGKLALSIGGDNNLRTWNLVTGVHAFATNLTSRGVHGRFADGIQWSPSGSLFTITGSKIFEIWSIEKADVIDSVEYETKVVSAQWISDTKLVCGLEDGNMSLYDSTTKENIVTKAHQSRVKCVAAMNDYIVTCDSTGTIKLWSNFDDEDITEICSTNASCRITCLTLVDNNYLKKEKPDEKIVEKVSEEKTHDQDSDDDEDEDEKEILPPPVRKRREVVIIEEEINEIKVPLEKKLMKKDGKKKRTHEHNQDEVVSPPKQQKIVEERIKKSKKANKFKNVTNCVEETQEEISNFVTTKNHNSVQQNSEVSPIISKNKSKKKNKQNRTLDKITTDFSEQAIERNKKSKKDNSKNIDNIEFMKIEGQKSKKNRLNKNNKSSIMDSKKAKLHENEQLDFESEELLVTKLKDNRKKSKKNKINIESIETSLEDEKTENSESVDFELQKTFNEDERVKSSKNKNKKNKFIKNTEESVKKTQKSKSVKELEESQEINENNHMKKSKKNKIKVKEDSGIESNDAESNQIIEEKSRNMKKSNKKTKNYSYNTPDSGIVVCDVNKTKKNKSLKRLQKGKNV